MCRTVPGIEHSVNGSMCVAQTFLLRQPTSLVLFHWWWHIQLKQSKENIMSYFCTQGQRLQLCVRVYRHCNSKPFICRGYSLLVRNHSGWFLKLKEGDQWNATSTLALCCPNSHYQCKTSQSIKSSQTQLYASKLLCYEGGCIAVWSVW